MKHEDFLEAARNHQIWFKEQVLKKEDSYMRKNKDGGETEVRSSLAKKDEKDDDDGYIIFFEGFRQAITKALEGKKDSDPIFTNLLRSEHIPYNIFFPMSYDKAGAARLFNCIIGNGRISVVDDIEIEHEPLPRPKDKNYESDVSGRILNTIGDHTSFDVFVKYTTPEGKKGGIGIEVKYTEKEYSVKKVSKEWKTTHDALGGIQLAKNYKEISKSCGWFKNEYIDDVSAGDKTRLSKHVAANRYRQIWRNHILGASLLELKADHPDHLDEFTSLTVYPKENGHFSNEDKGNDKDLWKEYKSKLTEEGKKTLQYKTYEDLFTLMQECFNEDKIPQLKEWVDYLKRRYTEFE